mgnify:CR=1 FL=1
MKLNFFNFFKFFNPIFFSFSKFFFRKSCSSCVSGTPGKSKKVARAESWRFESSMYVNPHPRNTSRTARMSTHQLPYQLVSQRDTLQQQNNRSHIAQLLGRTTQVIEQQRYQQVLDKL